MPKRSRRGLACAATAQVREWLTAAIAHFVPRPEAAFLTTTDEATLDLLASTLDTV